jgi:diguanylate cyclase (GGDEF)-like protein
MEQGAAMAARNVAPLSVAILDIDHFKAVNDDLGHSAGDEVLRRFAAHGAGELRSTDVLGRWGGEEFLLLVPTDSAGIEALLARIRERVRRGCIDGRTVTFSAGIACCAPGEAVDAMLARADAALYEAKRAGRDRWRVAG